MSQTSTKKTKALKIKPTTETQRRRENLYVFSIPM